MFTGEEVSINHLRKALGSIHCIKEEERKSVSFLAQNYWCLLYRNKAQKYITLSIPILETLTAALSKNREWLERKGSVYKHVCVQRKP